MTANFFFFSFRLCVPLFLAPLSAAWIDFNNNMQFETDEMVMNERTAVSAEITNPFSVPDSAVIGSARMRVLVMETTSTADPDPCAQYVYGGMKDFTVTIGSHGTDKSGDGDEGLSLGSGILIFLACLVFVYLVGGIVYNKKVRPSDDLFPGVGFWREVPGLVKDGCSFTLAKINAMRKGGGTTTYEEF